MTKTKKKVMLSGMALLVGVGAGASTIGAVPAQEVEAASMVSLFGKVKTMKMDKVVYADKNAQKGARIPGFYKKGTKYKVLHVYKNGYFRVSIIGTKGASWMHYTSIIHD